MLTNTTKRTLVIDNIYEVDCTISFLNPGFVFVCVQAWKVVSVTWSSEARVVSCCLDYTW